MHTVENPGAKKTERHGTDRKAFSVMLSQIPRSVRFILRHGSSQGGFGLLDSLLGVGVTAVIIVLLTTVVFRTGQGVDGSNTQIKAFRELEDAMAFMASDVSMAKDVTLSADANCVAPYSPAPAWANTVTLRGTDYYNNNNIGHTAIYYISGTNLKRTYDGVDNTVASSISSVLFCLRSSTYCVGTDCTYIRNQITARFTVNTTEGTKGLYETQTYRFFMRPQ